jgi:hypothetical protein
MTSTAAATGAPAELRRSSDGAVAVAAAAAAAAAAATAPINEFDYSFSLEANTFMQRDKKAKKKVQTKDREVSMV